MRRRQRSFDSSVALRWIARPRKLRGDLGPSTRSSRFAHTNVLARWSIAIADPRVRWISELAPVRHYGALLGVIAEIWPKGWIRQERLRSLLEVLFGSFLRTERAVGYLESLDPRFRDAAIEALAESPAPQVAAALAFAALRDVGTETYFEWQPFLEPGLGWGVFDPSDAAADLATALCSTHVTAAILSTRLSNVSTYVDDPHWCLRVAAELGLDAVRIAAAKHPVYNVEIDADGLIDLLNDPRSVALLRAGLIYRTGSGIRLRAGSDVIAVATGKLLFGRVQGRTVSSAQPITDSILDGLVDGRRVVQCAIAAG